MKVSRLDGEMRVYERAFDLRVPAGMFPVVRVDGRGFHRLTREVLGVREAHDPRVRAGMHAVATRVMDCGFRAVFAYTQADEVSVLLHRDDDTFQRRLAKLYSVFAGEASAAFTAAAGVAGAFDARVVPFARAEEVVRYFAWRQADATRNALNARVYWALRAAGADAAAATSRLRGMGHAAKHELLFAEAGVNFNDLSAAERRGEGFRWVSVEKPGVDPRSGKATVGRRREVRAEAELPRGEAWAAYVAARCREAGAD